VYTYVRTLSNPARKKLNVDAKSLTTYRPTLIKLYTGTALIVHI